MMIHTMLETTERVMCIMAASLLMSVMTIITTSLNGEKGNQELSLLSAWRLIRIMFSRSWQRELVC